MKAVIALRVSTEEQADSKLGLEAQLSDCLRYIRQKKIPSHIGPYSDVDITGSSKLCDRPHLLEAIDQLKKGDILLVAKRDRLFRGDPIDVAMIEAAVKRKGARIVSVAGEGTENDDPSSILMRRMIDAFGEYELLVIRARTRAALAAKIARMEVVGEVRFGYDAVPNPRPKTPREVQEGRTPMMLVANATEQAVIRQMEQWRTEGESYRAIAERLTAAGVRTKTGNSAWVHTAVARILKRSVAA